MGKVLSRVARFVAVLFAIMFVLTTIAALLLVNLDLELLVAAPYKTALARQQVYGRMPGLIAGQLVMTMNYNPCAANPLVCENISPEVKDCAKAALGDQRFILLSSNNDEQPREAELQQLQVCVDKYQPGLITSGNSSGGIPTLFKSISAGEMETVITILLPPDQLKVQTESLLDQVFSYLNGQQDAITIDLVSLKQSLASQTSLETILELVRSHPACTIEQLGRILIVVATGKGDLVMCRPSDDLLDLVTPIIGSQLKAAVALIPNTWVITLQSGQNPTNFGPLGSGPAAGIRFARLVFRLSPDVPLFFLLLISFLVIRTPKALLRWWGIPFFFAGLLSVVLGIFASVFFEQGWSTLLASRIPPTIFIGIVTVLHDLTRAILQIYLRGIFYSGASLALLGLGMWIGSGFVNKKKAGPAESLPTIL